eukprot:gnl/Dysnectes_brevis/6272_a9617_276.p1 GENE.gnl/Dysnectes_brevis/6272_a9617_276~~gnl/Dysnectes_brevis/6272_a9617_276.p1  ORF type:complete len:1011 (+),score=216.89 gnl/Dysnectes_brevis/6272_a9617_276:43-3033(+)
MKSQVEPEAVQGFLIPGESVRYHTKVSLLGDFKSSYFQAQTFEYAEEPLPEVEESQIIQCTLLITNYRGFFFCLPNSILLSIPLDHLDTITKFGGKRGSRNPLNYGLEISTIFHRHLKFAVSKYANRRNEILQSFSLASMPTYHTDRICHLRAPLPSPGWALFNPLTNAINMDAAVPANLRTALDRVLLLRGSQQDTTCYASVRPDVAEQAGERESESGWSVSALNADYSLCPSYPAVIIVPAALTEEQVRQTAVHRSSSRLPVLSWISPRNGAPMIRSSQPMASDKGAKADKALLAACRDLSPARRLTVFDARPWVNVQANRVAGKGVERPEVYGDSVSRVQLLGIANIHVVRDSYLDARAAARAASGAASSSTPYVDLVASRWLDHQLTILRGAAAVCAGLDAGECAHVHCFTDDHEILTNKGFMNREQMQAMEAVDQSGLLVAGYDSETDSIVYEQHSRLVVNQHDASNPASLVEFTQDTQGVSLVVTDGHDMLCSIGDDKHFTKVKALALSKLVPSTCAVTVKFKCLAGNGVDVIPRLEFLDLLPNVNDHTIAAFLALWGYWLGNGSLHFTSSAGHIAFNPINEVGCTYLTKLFDTLDLENGRDFSYQPKGDLLDSSHCYRLHEPKWFSFYATHYAAKYSVPESSPWAAVGHREEQEPEGIKAAKWLLSWAWTLNKLQCRSVLEGLRMAAGDGSEAASTERRYHIFTSSSGFRDELIRLCIHGGYSTTFQLVGSVSDHGSTRGAPIASEHDSWMVTYTDDEATANPTIHLSTDVTTYTTTDTATWCVTVPHGHLIARRVVKSPVGIVTKASRPTFTGNCSDGWDRTSQLTSLAMLLSDPAQRTTEGFCKLIEREWCSYGHRFGTRCRGEKYTPSVPRTASSQWSPVFLQWVCCVRQVMRQHPRAFGFGEDLLLALVHHVCSGRHGSFRFDCERERISAELPLCTLSLWDLLLKDGVGLDNPDYDPEYGSEGVLELDLSPHSIWFWPRFWGSV